MKYYKNSVFFINLYENDILYGCHGNRYGQKKLYLLKEYNLDIRISLYDALKGISNFDFFSKNLKAIFEVIHQRSRGGIP